MYENVKKINKYQEFDHCGTLRLLVCLLLVPDPSQAGNVINKDITLKLVSLSTTISMIRIWIIWQQTYDEYTTLKWPYGERRLFFIKKCIN